MKKELLTIEFRYLDAPDGVWDCENKNKKITIGIFDTLDEAIQVGNKALQELSKQFEVRSDDKFSLNGNCVGGPQKLVTNCCYPTNHVEYFAQITTLDFADLLTTIQMTFEAVERYKQYRKKLDEEDEA